MIDIRECTREDIEQLWEICKNHSQEEFQMWGGDFVYDYPPKLKQMVRRIADSKDTKLFAVEKFGRVIGFAEITNINAVKGVGELSRILLRQEERGKRYGSQAIDQLIAYAVQELGLNEMTLIVYSFNHRARRCYEKLGFVYERKLVRPNRPEAIRMKIDIRGRKKVSQIHNFDETVNRWGTGCKKYAADGYSEEVLPMWIADTDFKSPQPVIDALKKRIDHGVYGYPVVSQEFKKAIQYWQKIRFNWDIPMEAVEFIPGVIPGIICAMRALSCPGDNIVIHSPCYPPFRDLASHNGRHLLASRLKVINGQYRIDFEDLEQKLSDIRTKLFILCNPQNPTGRVFDLEELKRIGELCVKYQVVVLSDEIHGDLVYKGYKHVPFASISKEFADNSIIFVNASKTFNTAGFRTAGLICLNPHMKALVHEAILDNKGIGENIGGTTAAIAAYNHCSYYADQLVDYLEGNLDIVCDELRKTDKIQLIRPEGTYLLWLDCRKLAMSESQLVDFFEKKAKLRFNNGTSFGLEGTGFMRMNIATQRVNVQEAMRRILEALQSL